MIKNIVFDLGNVLISWKPEEYINKKEFPEDIKKTILSDIFGSREWLMLDNGDFTTSEAIALIASRSSLKRDLIDHIFDLRSEIMFPLTGNTKIIPELKKKGFKLYYLSNFPDDIFDDIKSGYDFFHLFDGGIISARVKFSKPDVRIYNTLFQLYSLRPEECLFIDDNEENIKSAVSLGMKGIYTRGEPDISSMVYSQIG